MSNFFKEIEGLVAPYRGKDPRLVQILLRLARAIEEDGSRIDVVEDVSNYWEQRFSLSGFAVADDILDNRVTVLLPRDESNNPIWSYILLKNFYISAKTAPAGGTFTPDIEVTNDFGTTWRPIFPTAVPPALVDGQDFIKYNLFSVDRLKDRYQMRVDVVENSGAADGVELVLTGIGVV